MKPERLRPSPAERQRMEATVQALESAMQAALDAAGVPARATVQGSIAKDTWLAGSTDIDLFVLHPPEIDESDMAARTRKVAHAVLDDAKEKYAQHPYVVGRFQGMDVDAVPAYAVDAPSDKMSAVDRTPFHTAWVKEHVGDLRDEVRLLKQWMKGVGVYGAETSIGGFSGYLVEVITIHAGSFDAVIQWLADGAPARAWVARAPDLDIQDPIDSSRNCAAAVTEATLARAVEAAQAFRDTGSDAFFFPAPPRAEAPATLRDHLAAAGQIWLGWEFPKAADRLDIVFPQFQKVLGRIEDELGRLGFATDRSHAWTDDTAVGLQWIVPDAPLPATKIHRGPPPDVQPHADAFTQKWIGHPDAEGPPEVVDGRLQVTVTQRERDVQAAWRRLAADLPLGKHVEKARKQATLHDDPGQVLPAWAPAVSDFILDRRPWQR